MTTCMKYVTDYFGLSASDTRYCMAQFGSSLNISSDPIIAAQHFNLMVTHEPTCGFCSSFAYIS